MITGPKFPREPGHKSLADKALEDGDASALCLYVNPNSWVPYRLQIAGLWIWHVLLRLPL